MMATDFYLGWVGVGGAAGEARLGVAGSVSRDGHRTDVRLNLVRLVEPGSAGGRD